jgi:hypothetical protein
MKQLMMAAMIPIQKLSSATEKANPAPKTRRVGGIKITSIIKVVMVLQEAMDERTDSVVVVVVVAAAAAII